MMKTFKKLGIEVVKFKSKPLVQKYEDTYKQAEYAYSRLRGWGYVK